MPARTPPFPVFCCINGDAVPPPLPLKEALRAFALGEADAIGPSEVRALARDEAVGRVGVLVICGLSGLGLNGLFEPEGRGDLADEADVPV